MGKDRRAICGLFQGQEEGSTAAAMDEPETDAIYFETMILQCRSTGCLQPIDRPMDFPSTGGAISQSKYLSSSSQMYISNLVPSSDDIWSISNASKEDVLDKDVHRRKNPESRMSPARITFMDFCHSPFFRG